jgi:hypothetical protein
MKRHSVRALVPGLALLALSTTSACRGRVPEPLTAEGEGEGEGEGEALVPDVACPGGPTCSGVLTDQPLLAAAAKRDVTPRGFEIARPSFLRLKDDPACAPEGFTVDGHTVCGVLKDNILDDCGTDAICFTDPDVAWPGADEDGSENDGNFNEYWLDCGLDRICPDNVPEAVEQRDNGRDDDGDGAIDDGEWPGADEGEGDGVFQALWIAGYDNNRPAMTIKDPLWARVIAFRQGDTTLALCTVDAIGLFFEEQKRITDRVEAAIPGDVDLVLVQASHTHEAPDTMGQWGFVDPFVSIPDAPGRSEAHMELIRQGCADAIVEAVAALEPVTIKVGQVDGGADGLLRDSRDPVIMNGMVTAVSVEATGTGDVVATLINWGNHPESLDSDNNAVSSDYLHAVRVALEEGLPATATHEARPARGGVAVYLQGAVGGLLGPNGFVINGRDGTVYENPNKTFARTDALGQNVAELGFAALAVAETQELPKLSFSRIRYRAKVENAIFHVGLNKGWFDREVFDFDENQAIAPGNLPHLETGVAIIKLGGLGMVTAPGELFPETFVGFSDDNAYGRPIIEEGNPNPPDLSQAPAPPYIRERLGTRFSIPLGLCQDETGYLVPSYDFKLAEGADAYLEEAPGDHYEETNSIGPESIVALTKNLDALFAFEATR